MVADFAVYAEHSDSNKSMVSTGGMYGGWNRRVFNRTEAHAAGGSIRLEPETGVVVLTRGVYRITAVSIVSYFDGEAAGGVPSKNPALGGYCRLRDETRPGCAEPETCLNEDAVAIGTMASANMLPSLIDTYLTVEKAEARLVLEHQVGPDVAGINLQLFVVSSPWHVMARLSIARVGEVAVRPVKPLGSRITSSLAPLPLPGSRLSAINRVFNAALGELLLDEGSYREIYQRYVGVEPRFLPQSSDCDPWVDAEDGELKALLARGELRFGYALASAPYFSGTGADLTGLDVELGTAVTEIISRHYLGDARLRAEFKEVALPDEEGDEQTLRLMGLCEGLVNGDFDIALTGQMMLPEAYLPGGYEMEWTAPTAMLFTGITYNGLDRHLLSLQEMKGILSGTLEDFLSYAVAESQRFQLEMRIFAVTNPGPSPGSAQNVVSEINRRNGRAVWDVGNVQRSNEVMLQATDHFSVGDSLATGATTLDPRFRGLYLNIPANLEKSPEGQEYVGLWPIAGFTARRRDA